MGQQQLLLIILGVIIVGIAVAIGISLFTTQSEASNKDQCVQDINNILQNAYQYRIKPTTLGGGANKYDGYKIPIKLQTDVNLDANVTYDPPTVATDLVTVKASGATVNTYLNGITGTIDGTGKITISGL